MKKEEKKIIKNIVLGLDLEESLKQYADFMIEKTYIFSLIRLMLQYYTMQEIIIEEEERLDSFLEENLQEIHKIIESILLSEELNQELYKKALININNIRDHATQTVRVLTAYVDALERYEHVMNRVEYEILEQTYKMDIEELKERIFSYILRDKSPLVMNNKIKTIIKELPVRMTKSRFFDILNDALAIYNASDISEVNNFIDMLRSTAMLDKPKGYETRYSELYNLIDTLSKTDFKTLNKEEFLNLREQMLIVSENIEKLVGNYLLFMEITNNVYAALLVHPHYHSNHNEVNIVRSMLLEIHKAFIESKAISENVDEMFLEIEGTQERLGEELVQCDAVLFDIKIEHRGLAASVDERIFENLFLVEKLLSNSIFVSLEENEEETQVADTSYIMCKRDELIASLSELFKNNQKEVNRSVMAGIFKNIPVFFASSLELKEYIEYTLHHCNNESELMACAEIIEEIIDDEEWE